LELGAASRMLRDALKDKSYRSTPLGLEVARYIRWKRSEWGATPDTIRDYEAILARLALFFADLELGDLETPLGAERLRECWDHYWGEKANRTRAKVLSVWRDFFDWAIANRSDEDGRPLIHGNPARMLRSPKRRGVKRDPFGEGMVEKTIVAQDYLPDKLATILVLQYAFRRGELASARIRDFDFERRQATVMGKGGKVRIVPIVEPAFWRDLGAVELEWGGRGQCLDFYIVHHRERRGMKTFYRPHKGYVPRSIHTWWYDRLDAAGLVGVARRGMGMHRGRHTVATELLTGPGGSIIAAQKVLGHEDLATTEEFYAAFDTSDTASVIRSVRGIKDV
jgi:integrase